MAKDFLDRLGRSLKEGARVVARESEEVARTAKLRLDMAGLAGKRDDLWEQIGKTLYEQFEQGREVPAEVLGLCQEVRDVIGRIKTKEAEIAALRAQAREKQGEAGPAQAEGGPGQAEEAAYCPQCGRPVGPESRFCSQCGAPLR